MKNLILAIAAIAAQSPQGFTIDLNTLQPVESGYCVALAETQNCFGLLGLEKVINVAKKHGAAVGGWYDNESGKYYFDATLVLNNLEDAILLGKLNNQLAVFDLNSQKEIRL